MVLSMAQHSTSGGRMRVSMLRGGWRAGATIDWQGPGQQFWLWPVARSTGMHSAHRTRHAAPPRSMRVAYSLLLWPNRPGGFRSDAGARLALPF